MPRQSEPDMRDKADKDIHTREGRDPYPSPRKGVAKADRPEDDTADPADLDPAAPHDRGVVENDKWRDGIDDAARQLAESGEKRAWKKGLTQNDPPRPQNRKH